MLDAIVCKYNNVFIIYIFSGSSRDGKKNGEIFGRHAQLCNNRTHTLARTAKLIEWQRFENEGEKIYTFPHN